MFVTLSGIVINVSPEQPENAEGPMRVTPSGIANEPAVVEGTNHRIVPDELKMGAVSPVQPENAEIPMLVTLYGIVIDVSLEQSKNAHEPMLVTLSGTVIDVNPEQL